MSGSGFRIEHLFAYLAIHSDGDEGVSAVQHGGVWIPMIGADDARMKSLRPEVEALVKHSKLPHVLAQFSVRTDLERIEP